MLLTSVHRLREQLKPGRRYLAQMCFIYFYSAQSYDFFQFPANWRVTSRRLKLFLYAFFAPPGYSEPPIVWVMGIKYELGMFWTEIQRRIQRRCRILKILKIECATFNLRDRLKQKAILSNRHQSLCKSRSQKCFLDSWWSPLRRNWCVIACQPVRDFRQRHLNSLKLKYACQRIW